MEDLTLTCSIYEMFSDKLRKYIETILSVRYIPYADVLEVQNKTVNDLMDVDHVDQVEVVKSSLRTLNKIYTEVNALEVNLAISDLFIEVDKDMDSQRIVCATKTDEILDKYEKLTLDVIEKEKLAAEATNKGKVTEVETYNSRFLQLEDKRQALSKYNNEIVGIVQSYGLTTDEITFATEGLDFSRISELYDEGIAYMESHGNSQNPVKKFRELFPNDLFQITVVGIAIFLCFTVVLDILAIVFFIGVFILNSRSTKHNSFVITLYGLLYSVNPLDFCKELGEDELLDTENIREQDIEEAQALLKKAGEELEEWSVEAIELKHSEINMEMMELNDEIDQMLQGKKGEFDREKAAILSTIKQFSRELKEEYDRILNSITKLGDTYNESAVMSTKFLIGMKDDILPEYVDIGLSNVVINLHNDLELMKKFTQVMLANALMSVKPGSLVVDVYDPNRFGQDILSFYNSELESVFNLDNSSLDVLLEELKSLALSNMKLFKDKSINEYNKESEEIGRTPKPYRLLLILSQPKKIEEDEALTEFMSYSARYGILVWLISNKDIKDTYVFKEPFSGVTSPYKVDLNTFGKTVSERLIYGIAHTKTDSLLWSDFVDIAIPDDQFWTHNCDEFIDLDPGFWEGDPTQYQGYTVGNVGNIHVIGVGGTGAGKSVFLNNIIANATRKYSPKDLELWLIDFKGVEFSFYLGEIMLPHIKACLCTSDGDYGGSVFKALRTEAERRYALLMEEGHKNIYTYNRQKRREGKEHEIIKRILAINDEFQVIFEKAEEKVKAQIIADIIYLSKVARAAGIHLFFTSQSMKGTVSDDILQQFTLRFALRCDKEVSMSVMNTPYAGNIKEAFGYLYVRSVEDASLEAQRLYRTPYLPDDMLRDHIKRCFDSAKEINYVQKNVITYQESIKHTVKEIAEFYEVNSKVVPDHGTFVLGERMVYDSNMAPQNVILGRENNTHIVAAFGNNIDLVMFFKSLMANIESHRGTGISLLCNSQVRDLHYLCELDKVGDDTCRLFSDIDTDVYYYVNLLETLAQSRSTTGKVDEPLYVMLIGWDKAVGFGVDKDMVLVNRLAVLMQTCGVLNIHIILLCVSVGDIATGIINASSNLIAGKCDENSSYKLLSNKLASKVYDEMSDGYMFVNKKGDVSRVKIYQSEVEREITASEIIITD